MTIGKEHHFAFIMNINHMVDAQSYTLMPGYELRRAVPNEVESIKKIIDQLPSDNPLVRHHSLWESRLPHEGALETLPADQWRYFVITFDGTIESAQKVADIQSAFNLGPVELEVGFTAHLRSMGIEWAVQPSYFFHILRAARQGFFQDVRSDDIEAVKSIYLKIQQHDSSLFDARKTLSLLSQLKGFPHESPLRFLGYFAILESLLTHNPKPGDPYDSITRQIQKKVVLLDNRFERRIDYKPFGKAKPETIWSKMYDYRSCLAHGGTPDFRGDHAVLKDQEHALSLLKETVKSTIVQAMTEPQLLLDLREC
jgi:hypothetical protein